MQGLTSKLLIDGKYRLVKRLGEGAFGEVYVAANILTSETFAVKIVIFLWFNSHK